MATMKIQADAVAQGDYLPGLDNGYVTQATTGDGYLTYPASGPGYAPAMPENTVLITYHDAEGEECFLILPSQSLVTVERA